MAIGIIAEFNPFHNGHKYLIRTAKETANKPVVVVMSGSFVQRGGIAITNKWARAERAISMGADLVLELPVTFSHNTAQRFATGAVGILGATGVVDTLAFGVETATAEELEKASELLINEPNDVSQKIKKYMDSGMSYPVARSRAYEGYFNKNILELPNNILALEYRRAITEQHLHMESLPITRIGTDHDSESVTNTIASASEIRRRIKDKENYSDFLPDTVSHVYDEKKLDAAVIANLRTMVPDKLSEINEVTEGLENKFIAEAKNCSDVESLCMAVKSKRYPLSRIRRIAYSSYLGLTKELCSLPPSYIRVLGMSPDGRDLLHKMKKTASLPIVIKTAEHKGDPILDINAKAEDVFALCAPSPPLQKGGNDFTTSPIIF